MTFVRPLPSSTETSVDVVTDQRTPFSESSTNTEDPSPSSISRLFTKAVVFIYRLVLLGLPDAYSTRAAKYASTPAEHVAFLTLLIGEWKIIVLGATFLLSILAIAELPHAADHTVIKTLGFMSLACGMMTFACSALLIAAFNAHHAYLEGHANDASVDAERQQVANAPLSAVNDFRLLAVRLLIYSQYAVQLFDPSQNMGVFWNHHVLIAQPATWMAWFSISSMSFLLLFIWKTNNSVITPPSYTSNSPIEPFVPGMVFTLVFTIGLVYFILAVRMIRSL